LARYNMSSKFQTHASITRMVQYLHLISNSALKLPNDLWLPASSQIPPQSSWQAEIGFSYIPTENLSFTLDLYSNTFLNLQVYPDDLEFLSALNEQGIASSLLSGEGRANGLEFLAKYDGNGKGFMFSYNLSKAERLVNGQNLDNWFPYDFDQRHRIKAFYYQKLGEHFQLGINGIFATGSPQLNIVDGQLGQGLVRFDPNPEGEKNTARSRAYHRIDFTLSYTLQRPKVGHRFTIGAYNAYNQANVAFHVADPIHMGNTTQPVSFIPFVPSFSYAVKF